VTGRRRSRISAALSATDQAGVFRTPSDASTAPRDDTAADRSREDAHGRQRRNKDEDATDIGASERQVIEGGVGEIVGDAFAPQIRAGRLDLPPRRARHDAVGELDAGLDAAPPLLSFLPTTRIKMRGRGAQSFFCLRR
jgi:hypothetical protein